MKDLAGHGKEEAAAEEEKKKNSKPDAASFPSDGNAEEEKKDDLFLFNENEFKDEKTGTSEQAGSLSNLLDLNNQQQVNITSAAMVYFKKCWTVGLGRYHSEGAAFGAKQYHIKRKSRCLGQMILKLLFQDDQLVDLSGVDLLPDDDDDVLLKIDSELGGLQPGQADLLGTGGKSQEDFFKESRREESEALLNQILDTSSEVCFSFSQILFHF